MGHANVTKYFWITCVDQLQLVFLTCLGTVIFEPLHVLHQEKNIMYFLFIILMHKDNGSLHIRDVNVSVNPL